MKISLNSLNKTNFYKSFKNTNLLLTTKNGSNSSINLSSLKKDTVSFEGKSAVVTDAFIELSSEEKEKIEKLLKKHYENNRNCLKFR